MIADVGDSKSLIILFEFDFTLQADFNFEDYIRPKVMTVLLYTVLYISSTGRDREI